MVKANNCSVDSRTCCYSVQKYGLWINQRSPIFLEKSTDVFQEDEECSGYKAQGEYWYRALDTHVNTRDFLLTVNRDKKTAKRFFKKMLKSLHVTAPRALAVDKNPAYPPVIDELKKEGLLPNTLCFCQKKYLNNIVELSHRFIKRLVKNSHGFQTSRSAVNYAIRLRNHEYDSPRTNMLCQKG